MLLAHANGLEPDDGGVERSVAEVTAKRVDHRGDVEVSMGVDPEGHAEHVDACGQAGICDDGHRCPLVGTERAGSTRQQPVDKTVMGACERRLL
jgi:hypothetical protein